MLNLFLQNVINVALIVIFTLLCLPSFFLIICGVANLIAQKYIRDKLIYGLLVLILGILLAGASITIIEYFGYIVNS